MSVYRTSDGTWMYVFMHCGRRYQKRFKSRNEASNAEAKLKVDIFGGLNVDTKITFREASKMFFEKHSKPNKANPRDEAGKIRKLNEIFGDKKLVNFTPLDIQYMRDHIRSKGLTYTTADKYHQLVKAIFNKMIMWRKFSGFNPACGVKLKREPNAHVRWLSKDELASLIPALPKNIYPYVIGALHTGMRRGEICSLQWENVTLSIQDIFVPKSKSGKSRHIPINDTLYRLLKDLYGDGKDQKDFVFGTLHPNFVYHRFKKICKKVGINDFRFHDLRHTFASWLVMSGVNIYQVSKWLGHTSVVTTEKYYAHLSPDYRREEIQKLNKLDEWSYSGNEPSPSESDLPNFYQTFENSEESRNPEDVKSPCKFSEITKTGP